MERQLQKLTWMKVRDLVPAQIDTIILPVGTVEAHGPACIGTDNFIPETIAQAITDRINALVAPTVSYGITRSLSRYPGSVAIKPDALAVYVRDILDSFVDTGFRNIFVMNGHGGNNAALKTAAFDFHRERKANICVIHWWALCDEMTREFFGHIGGHAGTDETAMVQAIDNDLVDLDAYDPETAYYYRPGADVYPVPGTILLYKEGEGYPDLDPERAKIYREKVTAKVGDFAEMVLARWHKAGF